MQGFADFSFYNQNSGFRFRFGNPPCRKGFIPSDFRELRH